MPRNILAKKEEVYKVLLEQINNENVFYFTYILLEVLPVEVKTEIEILNLDSGT